MELTVIGFLFIWTIESSLTLLVCTCNYIYAKFWWRTSVMTDEFNTILIQCVTLHNKQFTLQTSFVMSDKEKQGRGIVQRRKAVCTSISQYLLSSFSTSQKNQFTWNISKLCQKLPLNAYFSNKFRLVCKSLTQSIPTLLHDSSNKTEMFNN